MQNKNYNIFFELGLVLVLLQVNRLFFYLANKNFFDVLSYKDVFVSFLLGFRYDSFVILIVNSVYVLLTIMQSYFGSNKISRLLLKTWFVLTNGFILFLNFIDIFYYPYTYERLNPSFWEYLDTQKNIDSLNVQFINEYWFGICLLLISILSLTIVFKNITNTRVNHFTLAQKRTWLPSLIGLFLTITLISENYIPFSSFVKKSECWAYISQPNQIDLATNTAYNIFESLNREAETAPKAQITAFDYQKIHVNNNGEKKNVVILILESFARENIPSLNPEQKGYLTFLDSLMRESYYFPNAFANGRKSIDAIPAVWNSIPSAEVPFILSHSNAKSFHGLPATLKKQGYTNLFFHGAHNGSMAFDRYAQQNYIDRYFGMAEYPYPERDFDGTWGIWDEPFFNFAAQKLDSITDPFFATIFSLSSHNPCRVPAKYEQQFKEGSLPIHKSLQYSDFALKQFFEEAKTKNWFKNTLFVFTADHSIHPINDYYKTSEMAFAIPLFFYDPSLPNFKKRDTRTAQHLDIFPSVIHHLGITDSILSLGNNLFDPQSPQEVFNQISGTYQYTHKEHILHCSSSQVYNMFDRENDHYMTKDEALKKPTKAQQLLKRFRKKVDLLQRIKTSQNTQL